MLSTYESLGTPSTILFEAAEDLSCHGNFHDESWRAIQANVAWRQRLNKAHTQQTALPEAKRTTAKELDSCNSSDALLMNCFCFPQILDILLQKLALPAQASEPVFGFRAAVPLRDGTTDATEIDLRIGSLIFEAKLTEKDFTSRPKPHVERYAQFRNVFEVDLLPSNETEFHSYQLIRNVLAAQHLNTTLIVLLDQRRPDLLQEWWSIHAAIKPAPLRARCSVRSWQQLRAAAPRELAAFLEEKYDL